MYWLRWFSSTPGGLLWDVVLNPGVGGSTAGTDVLPGPVQIQKIKILNGAATIDGGVVTPTNPFPVQVVPNTTGGGSDYHKVSAASNNAASVKGAAGQVYGVQGFNVAGYPVYVKLYDKATAPNPAADTPLRTVPMQSGVRCDDDIFQGLTFALGIGIAIVKGIADNDNTSVAASDCVVDVDYK